MTTSYKYSGKIEDLSDLFLHKVIALAEAENFTFTVSDGYSVTKFNEEMRSVDAEYKHFKGADADGSSDGSLVFYEHGAVGLLRNSSEWGWFVSFGRTQESAQRLLDKMRALCPKIVAEDDSVSVNFWYMSDHGPNYRTRSLVVPTWEEIVGNYNQITRDQVQKILNPDFRPTRGGQLILWSGEPGTGKTTALRAMADAWRPWCEMHYITDPELFFGARADYMIQVLTQEASDDKWRLMILEDTGELLKVDAKQQVGQGLSRLLNSVDGMIGQGLKFLVLVTTNEEVGTLHPAISRPGRCLTQTEFLPLTPNEASRWLEDHGVDTKLPASRTIADLYAVAENFEQKPKRVVGFRAENLVAV